MPPSILLIDDDPNVTYIIKRVLKPEGYTVYVAHDFNQAKVLIAENDVFLVIMDLFSDRGAADPIEELRKIDENLKIILLSGYSNVFELVEGLGLEVHSAFLKPVDFELLLSTIRGVEEETGSTSPSMRFGESGSDAASLGPQ